MRFYSIICFLFILFMSSCSNDDKTIDVVVERLERGAILRNIDRVNPNFERTDTESFFSVTLEEQDLEEGEIFDFVRLYLQFRDRTPENGILPSVSEIQLRDVPSSDFQPGNNGLPVGTITVTYQEALDALSLNSSTILAGDQFYLRTEIHLTDGRTFSTDSGSASILTDACFFKSPYRYIINVIDSIDNDLFTGIYNYEIITDPLSPFSGINNQGVVTITAGSTPNVRNTGIIGEGLEFTIAGNNVYPKIYQSVNLLCRESAIHVLSGQDEQQFGQIDIIDDTVFELDLVIGYEGWTGSGGDLGTPEISTFRFSKQ